MATRDSDVAPVRDPEATLERALIEEFLQERGYDSNSVRALPPHEAKRLLSEASVFAAAKLAEVAARAHYIHEIHGEE